jgi:DNA-binding transcriptional regulator YhcF (GntR family)
MSNNNIKSERNTYKRKHIVDYIIEDIQTGKIGIGSSLPSLNEVREQFGVSRMTVVNAYRELKTMGIIKSIPRKEFRVAASKNIVKHRILLFLDELNGFKEVLYNSFKEGIGKHGTVDVFFHHFNADVFETIIRGNIGNYTSYVVMPIPQKNCGPVLKTIPEGKLYILDVGLFPYGKKYPSVCQNFEKDIFTALTSAQDLLTKYNKLVLVYLDVIQMEKGIINGFDIFCKKHGFESEKIHSTENRKPVKGECYVVIYDKLLVPIVNAVCEDKLELGKDVGIISHDENPLKTIMANGLTTISTDFRCMGLTMADMVLNRKKDHIENPHYMTRRKSL